MTLLRRLAFAALAVPFALALSACGSKADSGPPKGGPVAAVAAPAGKMWSEVVAKTPEDGMLMGNPNAPIKLVEYGSLSCPHCAKLANDGMQTLMSKYVDSGRVSYEFRSYAVHGIIDVPLTVLVRCASTDAFFPLVEQIYADQEALMTRAEQGNAQAQAAGNLPPEKRYVALADAFGLPEWFAARGISIDQAHACLADTAAAQREADETKKAYDAGIDQTPTLFLNGSKLDAAEWEQLEPLLQAAGAR